MSNQSILINQPVSRLHTKNWRRFGTVIEIDEATKRARVLWTRAQYVGDGVGVIFPNGKEHDLKIRTWVAINSLTFDRIKADLENKLIIQPTGDIEWPGTGIKLSKHFQYEAIPATNQPNWKAEGKIFVIFGFEDTDLTPAIDARDYRIIQGRVY